MESPTPPSTTAWRQVDPSIVLFWRLGALLRSLFLGLPFIALIAASAAYFVHISLAVVVLALYALLFVVRVFVWPRLTYQRLSFRVGERDLRVASGVIFRQETIIPFSRIQFVDSHQGPIERLFSLARVYVYTASGPAPDGGIPGLRSEEASALRDELAHAHRRDEGDGV